MICQRRGPLYRHQAQHVRWATPDVWRGQFWPMLGVALLCGSAMAGVVLGFVAMGVG